MLKHITSIIDIVIGVTACHTIFVEISPLQVNAIQEIDYSGVCLIVAHTN